jgi:transposase InsO family protein
MAWELQKVEDQRKKLLEAYIGGDATMADLCRQFGVSRKTAYKWYNRYVEGNFDEVCLRDISRAPHEPNSVFTHNQLELAVDVKLAHKSWGPKKIIALLRRDFPEQRWPSERRLYEILKEHHLVCSRKIRNRVCATHSLGKLNDSNDVWMADFKGWFMTQSKEKCEPLTITDGHSRYLIRCEHLREKSARYVWLAFARAFREYGLPLRLRTDNGAPFGSVGAGRLTQLSVNLIKAGVLPEWINPGHPEENGQHERFHRTLKETTANPPAKTLKEQLKRIREFQREYNYDRPHEALQMNTPASCYNTSPRRWDGILRPPEYKTENVRVHKVHPSGCIAMKGTEYYIGRALPGEYVGLEEDGFGGYNVYFGPVYLGNLKEAQGLERPRHQGKRRK